MENLLIHYWYWILVPLMIIEWPIITITLALLSHHLGISFWLLLILSFVWDFMWDVIHYYVGIFSQKKILQYQQKNNKYLAWIDSKIDHKSLLDTLIVVKYFPPITSIGLLYLWFKRTNLTKFMLYDAAIVMVNSIVLVTIWYYFWWYVTSSSNTSYIIAGILISLGAIYFAAKYIRSLIVKHITHDKL